MIEFPEAPSVPLRLDEEGVMRVGQTRVTLQSVITAFQQGATPETVVQKFTTLSLADVYLVLAYYLQNQAGLDSYLMEQQALTEAARHENDRRFDPNGIRERLLAR
jgi:uncharacterized protein (DUF433 family)